MIDELFKKHGTDKGSQHHNYSPYYDLMFAPYKDKNIFLLEIGVQEGRSLRAWKDYFQYGNIIGIDIKENPEVVEDSRLTVFKADQTNPSDLSRLNYFNIIIDDGSHLSSDILFTFSHLFKTMQSGGLYVIEDVLCDYDPRWNKGESVIDRVREMVGEVQMNGKVSRERLVSNKFENIKLYDAEYFEKNIEWVFVASGIIFIKKI